VPATSAIAALPINPNFDTFRVTATPTSLLPDPIYDGLMTHPSWISPEPRNYCCASRSSARFGDLQHINGQAERAQVSAIYL